MEAFSDDEKIYVTKHAKKTAEKKNKNKLIKDNVCSI